jgi:EmrB/QacA subfamily drug resistance transporter
VEVRPAQHLQAIRQRHVQNRTPGVYAAARLRRVPSPLALCDGMTTEVERQHYNITLGVLTLGGIAFALQQTMIIPALPQLQREFDTSTGWVTWLLTGFLLSASVLTPLLGKLGDQYGKERLLLISLGIFFVGSVAAIFAPNIWVLIACRIVQGTGAAVFPLSFGIIRDEFPPEKIGVAVGIISAVFGVGGGVGLVLSGLLLDHLAWQWIFAVGAAAVGGALVLIYLFVPESPIKTPSRLDVGGASLLSAGLLALLVALTEGESWGWSSGRIVALLIAALVLLFSWGRYELRVPEPMVDMRMLAHRPVLFANVTAMLAGFALFGSFVLVPYFVQTPSSVGYGFGANATTTGLYLIPSAVVGFLTGPLAGVLGNRLGSKWPLASGMALGGVGAGMLALFHAAPWHVVLGMTVLGAGVPMAFAAMANVVVESVRQSETGVATGMNTVMRTVGGVIGGQAGAAILTGDTIAGTPIPAESAFTIAFAVAAAGAFTAAFVASFATPWRRLREPQVEPAA